MREKVEVGQLQFFCVDSVDSEGLYASGSHPAGRIRRNVEFERYILLEVLPFTRQINPDPRLVSFGCSLGAYQAMNVALRNPHQFDRVVAFSGRYDLAREFDEFRDLLDGYYDEDVYFNMPNRYLPGIEDPRLLAALRRLDITLTVSPWATRTHSWRTVVCSARRWGIEVCGTSSWCGGVVPTATATGARWRRSTFSPTPLTPRIGRVGQVGGRGQRS
ncbi:MAG: hypothetical protein JW395_4153 [Nitrospira sp.]|nr:hypothetical protein [Nitrospira sp.]